MKYDILITVEIDKTDGKVTFGYEHFFFIHFIVDSF